MKKFRVLNVYKWATMGGVERVFLNRAQAFKKHNKNVKFDVHFMHDSGGLKRFEKYISKHNLSENIELVDKFDANQYDIILAVDTPEILDLTNQHYKIFLECHTSYKNNRAYIRKLPNNIAGVIVPSIFFGLEVSEELPLYLKDKLFTLSNFVLENPHKIGEEHFVFSKKPLFYLGRLDKLKNIEEVLNIFQLYISKYGDDFVLVLAGPIIDHEINLYEMIGEYGVANRVVYMPPIDFENVDLFFDVMRRHNGVYISSSLSETFGLSSAEAIVNEIPSLLSYITAHAEIVDHKSEFLYSIGDYEEACDKLHNIGVNYQNLKEEIRDIKKRLTEEKFLVEWDDFINKMSMKCSPNR